MISYILEVSICWLGFYLLYLLLLSKETFFQLNRWYLLSTLLLSLCIPLSPSLSLFVNADENIATVYFAPIMESVDAIEATVIATTEESAPINLLSILFWVYLLGVLITGSRFLKGMFQIFRVYHKADKTRTAKGYTLVKTKKFHLPFSFFNALFWSESMPIETQDANNILCHEEAHVFQKHSLDVMILEIMGIIFWCSPMVYLYNKSLRVVHEYLADHAVIKNMPVNEYGHLLLKQSHSVLQVTLANNFIQSQLKQRIVMMTKTQSNQAALLKYLLFFPALVLMAFLFSNKESLAQTPETQITQTVPDDESIFQVVEDMPRFPGCETVGDVAERKTCAQKKMLEFIYSNIKYPKAARDKGVHGTVVVRFVVKKDGSIANASLLRDPGEGLGEEALRVLSHMPTWIPGKQRGKAVNVYFNLPVKYSLEGTSTSTPADKPSALSDPSIHKVVDEMPRFPGCEDIANEKERKACSQKKMLEYIYSNIKYPAAARKVGIEGTVVVRFIVDKEGNLTDFSLIRDIGGGCGEEAIRVLNSMNEMTEGWIPGKQNGEAVSVYFNMPVKYKLQAKATSATPSNELVLKAFSVSPNPTEGTFVINLEGEALPTQISMADLNGKEILNLSLKDFDGYYKNQFDMNGLAKGVYLIQVIQNDKIATQKLVIQ